MSIWCVVGKWRPERSCANRACWLRHPPLRPLLPLPPLPPPPLSPTLPCVGTVAKKVVLKLVYYSHVKHACESVFHPHHRRILSGYRRKQRGSIGGASLCSL